LGADLFDLDGTTDVITVDSYSNFFEEDSVKDTISSTVIHKIKGAFARPGILGMVVSDNGPPFASQEFINFAKKWDFTHLTSLPRYPQSNGKVEKAVKTSKTIMKKAVRAKSDLYLALLDFWNTSTETLQSSPAQRLLGRRSRTNFPMVSKLLRPKVLTTEDVQGGSNRAV
jgi:transposase InsO family protein